MVVSAWKRAISGAFTTAARWSNGLPQGGTEVDLLVGGKNYTVTSSALEAVAALDMASNATLTISGNSQFNVFSPVDLAADVFNSGTINITTTAIFALGEINSPGGDGELFNNGAVNIGAGSKLGIANTLFEFDGDGVVTMAAGADVVGDLASNETLDNDSDTISGAGTIGNADGLIGLALENGANGVIDANATTAMTLNTGTKEILNAGLIETTGAGGLAIDSPLNQEGQLVAAGTGALTIDDVALEGGGTVLIDKGASIVLDDATLTFGETVTIAAGGVLTTAGTFGSLDAGDIENAGTIRVVADSILLLNSAVSGAGKITVTSRAAGNAGLAITGSGASLLGGSIVLSNNLNNTIVTDEEAEQFGNFGTISGAGEIGDGLLRLFNSALGVVNADDSNALTIFADTTAMTDDAAAANFNAGTMETTGAGGLTIVGVLANSGVLSAAGVGALTLDGTEIDNGGGIVQTIGSGAILLENGAAIVGQTELAISAGGSMTTVDAGQLDTVEGSVFNQGAIDVALGTTLIVSGFWQNVGSIDIDGSAGGSTGIMIESGATWGLHDDGTITLNGARSFIHSAGINAFLNNEANTIEGSGQIGDGNMTINNLANGVIEANNGGLFINGLNGASVFNAGAMTASSTGNLAIETSVTNFGRLTANSGGFIDAEGDVSGNGLAQILGAGTIEFGEGASNDVVFGGKAAGTLILDNTTPSGADDPFTGSISGFASGKTTTDTIDLLDLQFNSATMSVSSSTFGSLDAQLVVSNGSVDSASLHLIGSFTAGEFHFARDNIGGTLITLAKT